MRAARIAKDPRFERLVCTHKGTYADDCLVQRVTEVLSATSNPARAHAVCLPTANVLALAGLALSAVRGASAAQVLHCRNM